MKLKTSETTPDFKMAGRSFKGYEIYKAELSYYTNKRNSDNSDNSDTYTTVNKFDYDVVDFEYDNKDLIFKIPQDGNLPACQMKFKKRRKIGEHRCEFEKSDAGHRATAFKVSCFQFGKTGLLSEDQL